MMSHDGCHIVACNWLPRTDTIAVSGDRRGRAFRHCSDHQGPEGASKGPQEGGCSPFRILACVANIQ